MGAGSRAEQLQDSSGNKRTQALPPTHWLNVPYTTSSFCSCSGMTQKELCGGSGIAPKAGPRASMGLLWPLPDSQMPCLVSFLMVLFPLSDTPFLLPASTHLPVWYYPPSSFCSCLSPLALLDPPQGSLGSLPQTPPPLLASLFPLSVHPTAWQALCWVGDTCRSDQHRHGPVLWNLGL